MRTLMLALIANAALFVFVPLAAAADTDGDEHPVQRWDQQINPPTTVIVPGAPVRFKVLSAFGGAAVRDNETGLVWEQSPSTPRGSWFDASVACNQLTTGGRLGWRLPTIQELASLVDPNAVRAPFLPGNPFSNVHSSVGSAYWSATTNAINSAFAWIVDFSDGLVLTAGYNKSSSLEFAWCVRGGQGVDPQ
jgi:hypothetical protein